MQEIQLLVLKARAYDLDRAQRREAFGELVTRFQDMAFGCAYAVLGDFHLAEDAAQEAFIEAYLNLVKLREPKAFASWFRQIVLRQCHRITRRKSLPTEPLEAALDIPSLQIDPSEAAERNELKEKVLAAIKALPENQRMVTTLFYINGYLEKDIAAFLEVPVKTVKSRLHASRKRLKERLITMVKDKLQENRPSKGEKFVKKVLNRLKRIKADAAIFSWGEDGVGFYETRSRELQNHHRVGLRSACRRLRDSLPRFADASDEEIRTSKLSVEEAQLVIAREIGFPTWNELIERARLIGTEHPAMVDENLKAAYEAVLSGDVETLRQIISEDPEVVQAFIPGEPRALLEAVSGSKADNETLVQIVETLLTAGAPLGYAVHLAVWNPKVLQTLIQAGTLNIDPESGFLALKSALLHGESRAADMLVQHGVEPKGFWMAAGISNMDRVKTYFDANGRLKPEAAGYRPNLNDVGWFSEVSRSDNPQEILDEALCIASLNGRLVMVKFLLEHGARANSTPPGLGGEWGPLQFAVFRGLTAVVKVLVEQGAEVDRLFGRPLNTALAWAAYGNNLELAQFLLSKGANPNFVNEKGITPLHYAVANLNVVLVKLLLDVGAPPDVRDKEYNGTPLGWLKPTARGEEIAKLLRAVTAQQNRK